MTAYLQSAALLALALLAVAVADACAPAYLALVPMSVVLAYLQSAALLALALYALVVADACLWNKWELNPTDSINEAVEIEALTRRATLRKCKHVCASNCLHAENRGML